MTADRTETGRDHATSALPPAPTAAVDDGETVETSAYDATGLRRQKTADGSTTHFVWDRVNLLAELDDTLARLAQYTDYPGVWGGLSSQRRNSTSSYYAFDLSANTRALFNGAGITDRYLYEAFGVEQIATGSTENPMRFGGQVGYFRDLAERLYVRARWYRPALAVWCARDPAFDNVPSPYTYVGQTPLLMQDPTGLLRCPPPWTCYLMPYDPTCFIWIALCARRPTPTPVDPGEKLRQLVKQCIEKCAGVSVTQARKCLKDCIRGAVTGDVCGALADYFWSKRVETALSDDCVAAAGRAYYKCLCNGVFSKAPVAGMMPCYFRAMKQMCQCNESEPGKRLDELQGIFMDELKKILGSDYEGIF